MTNERPIVNSAEPSKVSTISTTNTSAQQYVQSPSTESKPPTTVFGGSFKLPEYVKIIIYFLIIFIPICCLMLWFINKGRKVSMMLDKTMEENENLQRQIQNLKTQNLRLERGSGSTSDNGSCCSRQQPKQQLRPSNLKPHHPQQSYQQHQQHNQHNQQQSSDDNEEPFIEQPDSTIGNINLIIDPDGNLYTSTGIIFTAPGMEMNNGVKHSDVRIEEITDDENGTPIDDFDESDQVNNQTEDDSSMNQNDQNIKNVQDSEPLLDQENEETQTTQTTQTAQTKQPAKSTPKGAPSKK